MDDNQASEARQVVTLSVAGHGSKTHTANQTVARENKRTSPFDSRHNGTEYSS